MHDKQVALITGANQGIGRQIAQDLASHGFTVLIGSRDLARGQQAAAAIGPAAIALQLDVTDAASIAAAADRIHQELGRLDVLINNAAISNTSKQPGQSIQDYARTTRPSNVAFAEMRAVWDTNVFGVLAVYQAMLPLLRATPGARIVNISSGVGSLADTANPASPYRQGFGPVYPASKTALNALTLAMAIELEPEGIKVNAITPGFIGTNLNGYEGPGTVADGAREAVRVALLGPDSPPAPSPPGKTAPCHGDRPWPIWLSGHAGPLALTSAACATHRHGVYDVPSYPRPLVFLVGVIGLEHADLSPHRPSPPPGHP